MKKLKATTVRIILFIVLVLILGGIAASTYFANSFLNTTAEEVATMQSEATAVDAKIQNLLDLKKQLDENKAIVKKAENIVADSKLYQYQNQIIEDFSTYARKASISIQSYTFQSANANNAKGAAAAKSSGGGNSTTVTIAFGERISYNNLLHFLHLIEKNVTRMQISGVSISRAENKGEISVQSIDVKVFIK